MSEAFKRPALDILNELNRGKVAVELTDEIHAMTQAVRDTGKKGRITVHLDYAPYDADADQIEVAATVVVKEPKRTPRPSLFFVTDDGNLTRTDPNQTTFTGMNAITGGRETHTRTDREAN